MVTLYLVFKEPPRLGDSTRISKSPRCVKRFLYSSVRRRRSNRPEDGPNVYPLERTGEREMYVTSPRVSSAIARFSKMPAVRAAPAPLAPDILGRPSRPIVTAAPFAPGRSRPRFPLTLPAAPRYGPHPASDHDRAAPE